MIVESGIAGSVGSVSAVVLSVVFLVACIGKLGRPGAAAAGFTSMSVPGALVRPVAFAEGALAVVLLARPAVGGVVALVTLSVFTAVVLRALRRARALGSGTVRCHCFGVGVEVTRRTLARNAALLGLALLSVGVDRLRLTVPSVLLVGSAVGVAAVARELHAVRSSVGRLFPVVGAPR